MIVGEPPQVDVFPPVEELLPHRGTMLLLDRVTEFQANRLVAEYSPSAEAWYADTMGNMPGWVGIELMAQSVAAHVAMLKKQAGLPLKMGALLGTRRYSMALSAAGCFRAGQVLRICVTEEFHDDSGLGAYACSIICAGETLATAVLKTFEPDDFGAFVQGNSL